MPLFVSFLSIHPALSPPPRWRLELRRQRLTATPLNQPPPPHPAQLDDSGPSPAAAQASRLRATHSRNLPSAGPGCPSRLSESSRVFPSRPPAGLSHAPARPRRPSALPSHPPAPVRATRLPSVQDARPGPDAAPPAYHAEADARVSVAARASGPPPDPLPAVPADGPEARVHVAPGARATPTQTPRSARALASTSTSSSLTSPPPLRSAGPYSRTGDSGFGSLAPRTRPPPSRLPRRRCRAGSTPGAVP
jgi:hypothetical protein